MAPLSIGPVIWKSDKWKIEIGESGGATSEWGFENGTEQQSASCSCSEWVPGVIAARYPQTQEQAGR